MTKQEKLEKVIKSAIKNYCEDDSIGISALTEIEQCPYCKKDLFKIRGLADYISDALNKHIAAIREYDGDFEIEIVPPVDGVEIKGE